MQPFMSNFDSIRSRLDAEKIRQRQMIQVESVSLWIFAFCITTPAVICNTSFAIRALLTTTRIYQALHWRTPVWALTDRIAPSAEVGLTNLPFTTLRSITRFDSTIYWVRTIGTSPWATRAPTAVILHASCTARRALIRHALLALRTPLDGAWLDEAVHDRTAAWACALALCNARVAFVRHASGALFAGDARILTAHLRDTARALLVDGQHMLGLALGPIVRLDALGLSRTFDCLTSVFHAAWTRRKVDAQGRRGSAADVGTGNGGRVLFSKFFGVGAKQTEERHGEGEEQVIHDGGLKRGWMEVSEEKLTKLCNAN